MALSRFNPMVQRAADSPSAGHSILYVEDEDTNWEVTEFALRDRFDLARAATASEAFSLLGRRKFDLVLMDIQLAGSDLNGIEVTQILKGRYDGAIPRYAEGVCCDAPIIFVTAYTARYDKAELQQAGGDELIAKPVDFTRLSLAISRLLVRGVNVLS